MSTPSPRELADRLIAEFDRNSEVGLDRALTEILRDLGFGRFNSEEMAYKFENTVLKDLQNRDREDLPFRLCDAGRRLVGKARSSALDNPDTIFARRVEGLARLLLDRLLTLTPHEFEIVCAAGLRLAGAREMRALCTGDEGGIDFYGRLEVRQPSERIPAGILYTTILPKDLLILGQAKRYSLDTRIGRPEIQLFKEQIRDCLEKYEGNERPPTHRVPESYYGSGEPSLGVFVTTASFAETATHSARSSGVVLVTGIQLAQFLAFHRVGIAQRDGNLHFDDSAFTHWLGDQRRSLT
jgi:hypothetical protein